VFNLQGSEIIVILLIALVVLGPEKLPDAVRRFMHTYNELKKMGSGFQSEIRSAFEEPMQEMRKTADMVRDAADPTKFVAEAEAEQRLRDDAAAAAATPVVASNGHRDDVDTDDHAPDGPAVDPGSETVATPGSPPPPPAPSRVAQSSTPPPPPPPFSASRPAEPSTSTSASGDASDHGGTPAPPPPPLIAPVTVIDPPPLPRRRPEDG
jgi:sec-independent protein translocase protein TatB